MPITTTPSERIGRCTRMRRFFVRFNRSESFVHTQSSAGFPIITSGFEFSVHTRAFSVRLATYAEISRGPTSVLIHIDVWQLVSVKPVKQRFCLANVVGNLKA